MKDTIAARIQRYALEGDDADLRRLLTIAEALAEPTRAALRRVGISDGWRVIDCGCGPLGALAVLAELVGPSGRVVGVDLSEDAVQRARRVIGALDLDTVDIVVGDVHDIAPALGTGFDLAFTRMFLVGECGCAAISSRMASRSGGMESPGAPQREPERFSPRQANRTGPA